MTPHYILIQHKNHQWIERLDGLNRLPSRYSYYDETAKVVEELNRLVDHIKKLEQEVQELKIRNEYAWQKNGKLNERIQSLIKLGLETTRPDGLAEWHEEEEL